MVDFLWGTFRTINLVLEIAVSISRMKRLARSITGSDAIVEVPADPKVVPGAAQRALAEAEARHRDGASFIDKYVSPTCK
jgi:hypothetical protein